MDIITKPGFVVSIIDDNNAFAPHNQVVNNVLEHILSHQITTR
jgi:hypothetical protein